MRASYPSRRYLRRPSLGDLSTVAATIQQIEGWGPGTRSYRNNNPGNLIAGSFASSYGCASADPQGFAICPNYQAGLDAEEGLIQSYANKGYSIQDTIAKWAPASDGNNPTSYAAQIASAAGLSPSDSLSAAIAGGTPPISSPDLSSVFDSSGSFDLAYIDFTDPVTIGVTIALGLGLAWALS